MAAPSVNSMQETASHPSAPSPHAHGELYAKFVQCQLPSSLAECSGMAEAVKYFHGLDKAPSVGLIMMTIGFMDENNLPYLFCKVLFDFIMAHRKQPGRLHDPSSGDGSGDSNNGEHESDITMPDQTDNEDEELIGLLSPRDDEDQDDEEVEDDSPVPSPPHAEGEDNEDQWMSDPPSPRDRRGNSEDSDD